MDTAALGRASCCALAIRPWSTDDGRAISFCGTWSCAGVGPATTGRAPVYPGRPATTGAAGTYGRVRAATTGTCAPVTMYPPTPWR
jgi:hypothetical protein